MKSMSGRRIDNLSAITLTFANGDNVAVMVGSAIANQMEDEPDITLLQIPVFINGQGCHIYLTTSEYKRSFKNSLMSELAMWVSRLGKEVR